MHYPQVAATLPGADEFEGLESRNGELLACLVRYFQQTPEASLGTLVVDWLEDPRLQELFLRLNEIAFESDLIKSPEKIQDNLQGAIQRLLREHRPENELDALLQKNRQSPLNREEKQRLNELLSRRHH
ncbi:hypothetical protein [Marinobacterium aestuariivivens]|uniref:DNA primase DnaG DnaB-binding domain-containing protein n=1 Tax=Marinobacterium aestuariivivens TaxID=1698799 RepID=A0ABW1ZWX7_9GAMM